MGRETNRQRPARRPRKRGRLPASPAALATSYPARTMQPCGLSPDRLVAWAFNPLGIAEGILCRADGYISYQPELIPLAGPSSSVRVSAHVDGLTEDTGYKLQLFYQGAEDGVYHEMHSAELSAGGRDVFTFEIDPSHVAKGQWFTCALHFGLLAELQRGSLEHAAALDEGAEPMKPIIIRGVDIEMRA